NREIPYSLAKFRADGMLFVPFLLWGWNEICAMATTEDSVFWPTALQHAHAHGKSLAEYGQDAMSIVREKFAAALQQLASQPYTLRKLAERFPGRVDLGRLPRGGQECFGRRDEIAFLNHAWRDGILNVVAFVGGGGYGKSTLVNKWLVKLGEHDWRGAHRVFGWSFYAQGSDPEREFSAQSFIDEALKFFGDNLPHLGSAWDRGQRLARMVGSTKSILILDGLEPLQWRIGELRKVKDPALSALIEGLAIANKGLCIITSRQPVAELFDYNGTTTTERNLDPLRRADGRDILRAKMVFGNDRELEEMSEVVGNHALAITLLGTWLTRKQLPRGATHRSLMAGLPAPVPTEQNPGARRILVAFEQVLQHSPELALLRIVGLFDQPCKVEEIQELLKRTETIGITDLLGGGASERIQLALGPLRDSKLLTYSPEEKIIDAHPIVREYFATSFRNKLPVRWRKMHAALAEVFNARSNPAPETADQAIPLYRSAVHLALSGQLAGAYEYYKRKILQGEKYYSHNVLASNGSDLSILSHLFSVPWRHVSTALAAADHPQVLRDAAIDWQTLGQFDISSESMMASYNIAVATKNFPEASFSASYLSELLVIRGKLDEAVHFGLESIVLAKRSSDRFAYISSLSSAGDALHQIGDFGGAFRLFREGIRYQKELQSEDQWKRHFTLQGYHYCCLQLSRGRPHLVERWCRRQIDLGISKSISLLTVALDYIALGRALLLLNNERSDGLAEARDIIEKGLNLVRQAQDASLLPVGLLARAELLRSEGFLVEAEHALDDVTRLSNHGTGMPLYKIDAEIERIKVLLKSGRSSKEHISRLIGGIDESIRKIGYMRRMPDVSALRKQVMG
ncbi:MAG: hypothetical protein ABL962_10870, partial [Fimbriimonadaceae bacterium]